MRRDGKRDNQRGSVMFYIFLAIALLAALTFFFTKDTRNSAGTQNASRIGQELYVQSNLIRSAITECTLGHPEGGGDLDGDGLICNDNSGACASKVIDNYNPPFPLTPSNTYNNALLSPGAVTTFTNDLVGNAARNVGCMYLDNATNTTKKQLIFQGTGSQARFLPPAPNNWPDWQYTNDAGGVSISIIPPSDGTSQAAANVLAAKFNLTLCQAYWSNVPGTAFTVWIQKANATCP